MRRDVDAAIAAAARRPMSRSTSRKAGAGERARSAPECIEPVDCQHSGLPHREMRSQAGHDAYAVATMAPTAMIFTPCHEGISHNVNEAIEARSVPGANLLLNAAVARANR